MRPRRLWPAYEKVLARFAPRRGGRSCGRCAGDLTRSATPTPTWSSPEAGRRGSLGGRGGGAGRGRACCWWSTTTPSAATSAGVGEGRALTGRRTGRSGPCRGRGDPHRRHRDGPLGGDKLAWASWSAAGEAAPSGLTKARAKVLVVAPGLIERPYVFAGNDGPGVMLSGAARRLVNLWSVRPRSTGPSSWSANEAGDAAATDLEAVGCGSGALVDARVGPHRGRGRRVTRSGSGAGRAVRTARSWTRICS